jgi:hypothetical protein
LFFSVQDEVTPRAIPDFSWNSFQTDFAIRFGTNRDTLEMAKAFGIQVVAVLAQLPRIGARRALLPCVGAFPMTNQEE